MEIIIVGGVFGFIVLLVIVRALMTSGERRTSGYHAPQLAEIPSPASGNMGGSESVTIAQTGPKKIQVIKVIREYTGLGLKEAKDMADYATKSPVIVANNLSASVAADFRRDLEQAGATVSVSSEHMAGPETTEPMETNIVTIQIEWIDVGPKKINVIKVIRQYTSLGLAEAKQATEVPSFTVTMPANVATQFLIDLREAGATANVHGI